MLYLDELVLDMSISDPKSVLRLIDATLRRSRGFRLRSEVEGGAEVAGEAMREKLKQELRQEQKHCIFSFFS